MVERLSQLGPHLLRQMGIEGRSAGTAMAQVVLNQAQVDPGFEQVGGVGMAQRVHVSVFVDAVVMHFQC